MSQYAKCVNGPEDSTLPSAPKMTGWPGIRTSDPVGDGSSIYLATAGQIMGPIPVAFRQFDPIPTINRFPTKMIHILYRTFLT